MKNLKLTLKKIVAPIFAPLYRGRGSILMFHRILPDDGRPRVHTKALEVTPKKLEEIIVFFKKKNYDFIKMDQVKTYLERKQKRRFVVFTFDDGYVDNYTIAYPIFKKHNVPFTIYVTTDMPDHKMLLWHYMLEEMMLRHLKISLDLSGESKEFDISDQVKKENVYNQLRRYLIDLPIAERKKTIEKWFLKQEGGDLFARVKKEALTWDQIAELSGDDLVEIGAHTISHPALNSLSENEIHEEVEGSKYRLEEKIGKTVDNFAYPYGSINEIGHREIDQLTKSQFKSAVTTRNGNVTCGHIFNNCAFPRFYINNCTNLEDLESQISGLRNFITNTKVRHVTI